MKQSEAFLRAIQAAYPAFEIESFELTGQGGQYNDVFLVNQEFIFRFPRHKESIESINCEAAILKGIQGRVPLPTPNPIFLVTEAQAGGYAFMGYHKIPGINLTRTCAQALNGTALQTVARQLGEFLVALHGVPLEVFGLQLPLKDTRQTWQKMYDDFHSHLFDYLPADARVQVDRQLETYLENPEVQSFIPVLRHGDFGPGNILFDPTSLTLSGIIDFSSAGAGDPALDVAALSTYGDGLMLELGNFYPISRAMTARAGFYRGTFALQEALYGALTGDQQALSAGLAGYLDAPDREA